LKAKWWLRWKLRYAARLLRRGIINRWQYSALAIKFGYEIWGKPLTNETRLEQYPFSLALGSALGLKTHHSEFEYRDLVETYGPFNEAITTSLSGVVQPTNEPTPPNAFNWNGDHENRAKSSALLLSPVNRGAFAVQGWWGEQERLFPLFTKMTVFIAGLVVGGVIGVIIGRLTH
jgi:hypothetical protein